MAGIHRDLVLSKTLQLMRKTDPALTGILARSTVVWVAVWKPDDTATEQQQKAGRGEWIEKAEGPLFICTRANAPHFQVIIKPRSQTQKNYISVDITDTFTFSNKKPNLQVVETDEKGLFNFHFPKDVEGLEGFDKAVSVMQRICDGATDPSQLPPLVSIPAAELGKLQQESGASNAPPPAAPRTFLVGELFATPPPQPPVAATQKPALGSAFVAAQESDNTSPVPQPAAPTTTAAPIEPQLSATELIAKLTTASLRPTASSSEVPYPPDSSTTGSNNNLAASQSGPMPPAQLMWQPSPPGHPPQQSTQPPRHQQPRPPPPPLPPPESPEPPPASIMASLFSGKSSDNTTAKSVHARTPSVAGSPLKQAAASRAAAPAAATSPALPHKKQDSSNLQSGGAKPVATTATVQHRTTASGSAPNVEIPDVVAAATPVACKAVATGVTIDRAVQSSSHANGAEGGAPQSNSTADSRRDATRRLFDVLLKDDRFLDAVSDALDATGLWHKSTSSKPSET